MDRYQRYCGVVCESSKGDVKVTRVLYVGPATHRPRFAAAAGNAPAW